MKETIFNGRRLVHIHEYLSRAIFRADPDDGRRFQMSADRLWGTYGAADTNGPSTITTNTSGVEEMVATTLSEYRAYCERLRKGEWGGPIVTGD